MHTQLHLTSLTTQKDVKIDMSVLCF